MIKYFEENPDALQITNNIYGDSKAKQRIWIELTHKLNATEGPLKPSFKWNKCWSDIVIYTENRARKIMAGEDTAGKCHRGPNDLERRMLILLGKEDILKYWESLTINTNTKVSAVDDRFYEDDLTSWSEIKVSIILKIKL